MRGPIVNITPGIFYKEFVTSARIGDKVRVFKDGKSWKTTIIRIDDFGMYWCATWWENIWGRSTYHEPQNVMKL